MSKSPAAMAAYWLCWRSCRLFLGTCDAPRPWGFAIFEEEYRFSEIPADLAFFSLAAFLFYLVFHRYLTGSARATEALNRSHAELELRVQQRTQALDAERDKLLRILDAMPDGICIINEDYEVEYINPVLQNDWGAVEQRKCYAYFAGRDSPCPECRTAQIMEGHTSNGVDGRTGPENVRIGRHAPARNRR